ncbi:MAG: V-type ATP synthase subunit I [Oscillospiraceae bacterium]
MATEKMKLVNVVGLMSELDEALEKCCESGCFHMEQAFSSAESKNMKLLNEKNPYQPVLKRLATLAGNLGIKLKEADAKRCSLESPRDFEQFCDDLTDKYNGLAQEKQKAQQIISERKAAEKQIKHLNGLNEDFDKIFACRHVAVRVGKLPVDNREKLEYYKDMDFFFVPFDSDRNFCWGMYFCPQEDKDAVDDMFKSLYFERIMIPDFVTGNTSEAFVRLDAEIEENSQIVKRIDEEIHEIAEETESNLLSAFSKLKYKNDIFELRKNVGNVHGKFYIKGFIPEKKESYFEKLFENMETVSAAFMPPDADPCCTPPTVLKNSWFTRPFGMMVEMYGLPDYGGFNPTSFVAITYALLFGIMFGDLGQGLVVFLAGFFVSKKISKQAGGIFTRVGLSSMVFGTLYGSVFGFEELLDPLYEKLGIGFLPLKVFKQTNFILITAVAIGVALIIMSMLINIYIGFKEKDYEKAVFGCNGIAGLIFYSSIMLGVAGTMLWDIKIMSPMFVIFLIVIPGICIFCRVPFSIALKYKEFKLSEDDEEMTIGGFIVENFFEMFEFVLSYVSNTMSFLRVGGFVLSHAGMMLVVMTLMEGVGAVGQPLVAVLGNAFVMVMEGMIVAIQIIRLEFYEIFSRFYEGNGKPFEPVKVEFSSQID